MVDGVRDDASTTVEGVETVFTVEDGADDERRGEFEH